MALISTVGELVDELMALLNDEESGILSTDHVMLNVAGRWTGILTVTTDENASPSVLIESED
jgi:hypothetical protein